MRQLYLSALAAAAIAAAGCVQAEQEFTLKADGSAEVKLRYTISEQTVAQIEAMQKMAKDNPNVKAQGTVPLDEKAIREVFEKQKAAGVELKSVKVESKDGTRHVQVEAACRDIAAAAKAAGGDKPAAVSLVKNGDGNYAMVLGVEQLAGLAGGNAPAEQKKQYQAMAKPMMAGFKLVMKFTVPGDPVESNATKTDGRTGSWVLDIADEKFFETVEKLAKEGLRLTFKGAGLDLKEIQPAPAKPEPQGEPEPK